MRNNGEWNTIKGGSRVFEIWQVAIAIVLSVLLLSLAVAAIFPREEKIGQNNQGAYEHVETSEHSEMMIFDNPNTMFAQVVDGRLHVYRLSDIENLDDLTIMPDLADTLKRLSVDNFFWYSSRTNDEAWCFYDGESQEQLEKAGDFLLKKLTPENSQPIRMTTHGEKVEEALVDGRGE